jgi:hypothetical protein
LLCALALSFAQPVVSHAQANPFEAFVQTMTAPARYRGPTVPFPPPGPRPLTAGWVLRSSSYPLSVHAPAAAPYIRVERALRALEFAYAWADAHGWPLPFPDAGAGGSADFDLYLAPAATAPAYARLDAPLSYTDLDAATTYAVLDPDVADAALDRCALAALIHAGLLGHDPPEVMRDSALRATAAFAAYQALGELGCDDARAESQAAPFMGATGSSDEQVTSLALMLVMMSERHDHGSGTFVRGAWELARQHSQSPSEQHVLPTFWQALAAALDRAGESLDQAAEEFALARYTAPRAHDDPSLLPLSAAAQVPVRVAPAYAALPRHLPEHEPGLGTYGSAYTRIDVSGAPRDSRLQVWLTGDPTTRWSLIAVRFDAGGRELGRVAAPARRVPQSYVPIELTPDTHDVLLTVIALPFALPGDTEEEDEADGSFRLVLGK